MFSFSGILVGVVIILAVSIIVLREAIVEFKK